MILVVDDNEDNREVLGTRLTLMGHAIATAENGRQALDMIHAAHAAHEPYELVFLDIMMPEVNGYQVLEALQADVELRHLSVIVLSALNELDSVVRCLELGAEDYLVKPFRPALLKARLNASLEKNRWRAQEQQYLAALQDRENKLDYLLRHFTPVMVAEQLKAAGELPRLGGVTRHMTILFADIRGYTTIAEQGPEVAMQELNRHFGVISRAALAHGGEINQYAGDMVMVLFNAHGHQPDHALRAARAACAMQANLTAARAAGEALDAAFGIGVNTGLAMVGFLGFEERFDYTAIGDTTNVAFRLCSKADGGQILLGPETYASVRDDIAARALGPMQLKNKSKTVDVYQVIV